MEGEPSSEQRLTPSSSWRYNRCYSFGIPLQNPDQYDLDMPLGELVVGAARETPRWRICFTPEGR